MDYSLATEVLLAQAHRASRFVPVGEDVSAETSR